MPRLRRFSSVGSKAYRDIEVTFSDARHLALSSATTSCKSSSPLVTARALYPFPCSKIIISTGPVL
jgi:hypothetical protein